MNTKNDQLVTFGWIRFSATGVLLVGVVVLAIGLWAVSRSGVRGLIAMVRTHWPVILAYETLFAALLLGGLWLRWHGAVGAAIIGTEKPMDLAFLSGILHSDTFPPHDPWLAGYAINYYYLGYLMLAVLAALTGASAGEAFNLGLATSFALTGLMVAGLVVALIGQAKRHAGERAGTWGAGAAALLGVVFVLVLGNQAGAWQVLTGSPQVVALDGRQLVSAVGQRLSGQNSIEIDPPVQSDPFENRMNTIFKLYYQAWVIWGIVAAFAAWALWQGAWRRPYFAAAWSVPALLLGLGALVYPLATLGWGQAWISRPPTLDGLALLRESAPDEAAALAWIGEHTQPDGIVLTAAGSSYDDATGRVAAVTGRPTLLGWPGSHERLWRRRSSEVLAEIADRERDIPTIYTTTSPAVAQQLLERYGVQYLYIGPVERQLYAGPGLDKFDAILELVFQQGDVRIYRCP
jgi:uncharacterized membrane protein